VLCSPSPSGTVTNRYVPLLIVWCWGAIKVWDGETGEVLADLRGHGAGGNPVAVWKEHTGEAEHDRIAITGFDGHLKVWDGEAFTLVHTLARGLSMHPVPFKSAEGPHRLLLVPVGGYIIQCWDPERGRLLHDGISQDCPIDAFHLFGYAYFSRAFRSSNFDFFSSFFRSAEGHHLLSTACSDPEAGIFFYLWDLGEAPAATAHVRAAHHLG
jgi:WD40 repeat protein